MEEYPRTASPLRELLVHRDYWRWSAAVQLMRLPTIMTPLAFVLLSTYITGAPSVGGLMVTVYVICITFFAMPAGRLLDRIGPVGGVPLLLGIAALVLSGLAVAAVMKASTLLLLALTGIAGALAAGAPGAMRVILSKVVSKRLLASALAIDATVIELVVVIAPLLVVIAAVPSPPGAIVAMAIVTLVAALFVHSLRRRAMDVPVQDELEDVSQPTVSKTRWWNRRYCFWLLVSMAFGHALGTAETGALSLAEQLGGGSGAAAAMIAVLSSGSVLSGFFCAAFSHRLTMETATQAYILLALMVASSTGLALSKSWAMAITAMFVLGICTAPLMTVRSHAAEEEIPSTRKAEGFGLINSLQSIGFALGGIFLATLPLNWMLFAGGMSGGVALVLAPLLLRRQVHRKKQEIDLQP